MKSLNRYTLLFVLLFAMTGCDGDWLVREPESIITEEQVWNDPEMIEGLLANYYDRLPRFHSLTDGQGQGWAEFALFTNAMWSGQENRDGLLNIENYGTTWWALWDYDLIRDLNLAIENIDQYSTELDPDQKNQFKAELRFLRAWVYFQHVKRMGGVPLVTETLEYDFSGDPSSVQIPRSTEAEIYNFIGSELDAIQDSLGHNAGSQTRANKYTALALKSRTMLYAGSVAYHNSRMSQPITLENEDGGRLVGIPGEMAQGYYEEALAAAEEVIQNSPNTLYNGVSGDPGANFYQAVTVKDGNNEVIFAEDFMASADRRHLFTYFNIPRPIREDNLDSSSLTPGLGLIEAYPYVDGSSGELQTRDATTGDYVYYDSVGEIFEGKDGRMDGTVIVPGESFRGQSVPMQAGVKVWNTSSGSYETVEGSALGSTYSGEEGGPEVDWTLTAGGGPHRTVQNVSASGFYLRKFVDNTTGASTRGTQSDTWWVRMRLSEMYLNAAEAAYQLSQLGGSATAQDAADYINVLRERAGFEQSGMLDGSSIDFETIMNERRIELAFEGHRLWDLIRWRRAHQVWNGDDSNPTANVAALYPYRVYRPGTPMHGKYVFDKIGPQAPSFVNARWFQMANYYARIPQDAINNNPELVQNPFH
ncbi:RagB/SusD family nutrient uptake outer membrane protein [Aliifodinibius sp. S!AR15-10]|uniref:RagB/SusD family nutrient uptake outer membrane protein n=1 Tax=Aliifodinibius sp. S!AR15-10 TaxID=2950437 RepID=UPI00285DD447|nr:RagB/SusD family nutrient uptake outer membrane protein [Aliifodinibius sp. S!AR15-10]MDR8392951.1 RagB/SusD family nutrient uptake outer membrane protein [Aliifodinibius sp. S!AR15-10]